jgi:ribosomal-protein-alanine N-acetyltransferase
MDFDFRPMYEQDAAAIAAWHYEEPYSFYDMEADPEDLEEFLDSSLWPDKNYAVYESGKLAGFFTFSASGDVVEIGLGMTGRGVGLQFVRAGLGFAHKKYARNRFKLAVAVFNVRAIKVYEKAGFRGTRTFMQDTNGDTYEFLEMTKVIPSAQGKNGDNLL